MTTRDGNRSLAVVSQVDIRQFHVVSALQLGLGYQ